MHNWAGNQEFIPRRVVSPQSVEQLCEVVGASGGVGVLGAGHSFTDIINDRDTLVRLGSMPREIVIDRERGTADVPGGVTYDELARVLHAGGWAVANLPSLPHVTLGGAVSTGTHGSGVRLRALADSVRAVTYVTGRGTLRTISADNDPDSFYGSVVALGALGVAVSYIIDLIPTFEVSQSVWTGVPLGATLERLPDILSSAYSVSVFTDWSADTHVVLKERAGSGPTTFAVGGRLAPGPVPHVPGGTTDGMTPQMSRPGPWHERLPHVLAGAALTSGSELQSEYLVPAVTAPMALEALRHGSAGFTSCLQVSEFRAIRADKHWLSPAHGRDSVSLHFTWHWDQRGVRRAIDVVEDILRPFDPRPHWGKLHEMPVEYLAATYPQAKRFHALATQFDPTGKFRSPMTSRLLRAIAALPPTPQ